MSRTYDDFPGALIWTAKATLAREESRCNPGADGSHSATFDRMKRKVMKQEAVSQARSELLADNIEDRFASMEKEQELDRLLAELKSRRQLGA